MTASIAPRTSLSPAERRVGLFSATIFLAVFALFAAIRIEGAVVAAGQASVEGKPRPVQSVDGGVIEEIRVADGDVVRAGDLLLRFDPSLVDVTEEIMGRRLSELTAQRLRLLAETAGRDAILPEESGADLDAIFRQDLAAHIDAAVFETHVAGQKELFEVRRTLQLGEAERASEAIAQYRNRALSLAAQIEASHAKRAFLEEEIANLSKLNARGLAPESRLLELQGREASEAAQLETLKAELAGNGNAIREADLQRAQAKRAFQEEVAVALRDVETALGETMLELRRLATERARLDVHAPVGGVVHEVQVAAAGEVLGPQSTLLTVIPDGGGVEFGFEIAPSSIDSVFLGQEARLRFPSFDQKTTPEIRGEIARISPDTVTDPATGRAFYRVVIAVDPSERARLGGREVLPGMPIEALLQTGSRSILSYLVKPLSDQVARAFLEG